NRGYVVEYGSRTLFLPNKFGKALRLADKLTPRELFEVEGAPAEEAAGVPGPVIQAATERLE
ncbi:MAG: hypothetical protein JRM86_03660, partial [Nitrososphaerota archaeon]|nr:hypothetical protein [Nitrososphaerota archaeon]